MAITDEELSAILDREERQAIAYNTTELSKEREDGLKRYHGEPYGNEEDGRSQVVSRTVQDTIEWQLPSLLKVFVSGDNVVDYQPRGPEDEEAAKQRTEYINYVFSQDNNGFLILHTVFKDGLIQKNGVVKVYYDDAAIDEVRTVKGMDDEAFTLLHDDPDVEIISDSPYASADAGPIAGASGVAMPGTGPQSAGAMPLPAEGNAFPDQNVATPTPYKSMVGSAGGAMGMDQAMSQPPAILHDVKYRKREGRVVVETVAPEDFLLSARTKSIRKSPYCADRKRKTLSDLIAEGFDRDKVMDLAGDGDNDITGERETRRQVDKMDTTDLSDREGVMREVWVTDHYILVDYDEDGIAERRRVVTAGSTSNILLNEEHEGSPPYASFSPILTPHRVIGQSVADQVSDLQLVDTVLTRQMLDNIYLTNVPRYAGTDDVNSDDWYSPNPGQKISTGGRNPNEVLMPITIPFTAQHTLGVLEHFATVRENRTGVTRYNQGMDADSLNKTARGITQIMTAAQQRQELMARIAAETFMKDMFALIDHCVTKYQNKARVVRIRNQWVTVDPRQWESNYDMTVNVGLGTGNKDQTLMHLQTIGAVQAQIVQLQGGAGGPLVNWENLHETSTKIVENAGLKHADLYFSDPKNAPPQEPQPDPEMIKIQQQGEIDKAKLAQQAQNDNAKLQMEERKMQGEFALKLMEANASIQLKREQAAVDAQMSRERMASDQSMAQQKIAGDQALARDKASSDTDTKRMAVEAKAQSADASGVQRAVESIAQTVAALIESQAKRDAAQDERMERLLAAVTAGAGANQGAQA
jgi:hypothetical protein